MATNKISPRATKKISELDSVESLNGSELIPVVQNGTTRKTTTDQIAIDVVDKVEVLLNNFGYEVPVPFEEGLVIRRSTQTVDYNGEVYAPLPSALPFTTTVLFNPSQWRVIQGVTYDELSSSSPGKGADLVGFRQGGEGAVPRTVSDKVGQIITLADFATPGAALSKAIIDDSAILIFKSATFGIPSDFPTLQAAVDRLCPMGNHVVITLMIEPGHVIESQLLLVGKDAGQFIIKAQDPVVHIDREALVTRFQARYPAFGADRQAVMPVINCLFNMTDTGPASTRDAFFIYGGGRIYFEHFAGCTNAGERGLHITNNSLAHARNANFSGAGTRAVRVANGSYASVRESDLQNCGAEGIAIASAFVDALGCNVSGSAVGIHCYDSTLRFESGLANNCGIGAQVYGSSVTARFAEFDNSEGIGVEVREGSVVNMRNTKVRGAGSHALYVSGATAMAQNADLSGASSSAVYCWGGWVSAENANLQNAVQHGILAESGSNVNAQGANAAGAGTNGFMNNNGSTINANGASGTLGRTANSLSRNGIIYGT